MQRALDENGSARSHELELRLLDPGQRAIGLASRGHSLRATRCPSRTSAAVLLVLAATDGEDVVAKRFRSL